MDFVVKATAESELSLKGQKQQIDIQSESQYNRLLYALLLT